MERLVKMLKRVHETLGGRGWMVLLMIFGLRKLPLLLKHERGRKPGFRAPSTRYIPSVPSWGRLLIRGWVDAVPTYFIRLPLGEKPVESVENEEKENDMEDVSDTSVEWVFENASLFIQEKAMIHLVKKEILVKELTRPYIVAMADRVVLPVIASRHIEVYRLQTRQYAFKVLYKPEPRDEPREMIVEDMPPLEEASLISDTDEVEDPSIEDMNQEVQGQEESENTLEEIPKWLLSPNKLNVFSPLEKVSNIASSLWTLETQTPVKKPIKSVEPTLNKRLPLLVVDDEDTPVFPEHVVNGHWHHPSTTQISSFPAIASWTLSNIVCLSITNNGLTVLPDDMESLVLLESLILRRNQLEMLPNSIAHLTMLKVLDVGYNQIHSLDDNLFQHLKAISTVVLAMNPIKSLPSSLGTSKDLTLLRVEGTPLSSPLDDLVFPLIQSLPRDLPSVDSLCQDQQVNPLGQGYLMRLLGYLKDVHELSRPSLGSRIRIPGSTSQDATPLPGFFSRRAQSFPAPVSQSAVGPTLSRSLSTLFTPEKEEMDLTRRCRVVQEMRDTERSYVSHLRTCLDLYMMPLMDDRLTPDEVSMIFTNLPQILEYHESQILPFLESAANAEDPIIGEAFGRFCENLGMYSEYMNNYDVSAAIVRSSVERLAAQASNTSGLQVFRKTSRKRSFSASNLVKSSSKKLAQIMQVAQADFRHSQLNLGGYLIMPIQRLPRYRLLLESVLKNTPSSHSDYMALDTAHESIKSLIQQCNESKRGKEHESIVTAVISKIKDPSGVLSSIQSTFGKFISFSTKFTVVKYVQPRYSPPEPGFDPLLFTNQKKKFKKVESEALIEWLFHPPKETSDSATKIARAIERGGPIASFGVPLVSGRRCSLIVFEHSICWCTKSVCESTITEDSFQMVDLVRVLPIHKSTLRVECVSIGPEDEKCLIRLNNGLETLYMLGSCTDSNLLVDQLLNIQ